MRFVLREVRQSRGISQQMLSARSQVSRSAIERLETGFSQPSLETAYKIATALGCTLDELVAETEEQKHV